MKVGGGDNELINMHIVCLVLIDGQNILVNYLKTTISNNSHCEVVSFVTHFLLGYKYTHI